MKNLILLLALFVTSQAMAVCTTPISRTNFSPLTVLGSTKLNADLNALYTQVNEFPGDCITDSTVTSAKILDGTIVNADISEGAQIARAKLASTNYVVSTSGSVNFVTNSATFVDVTNLSVTITTTGGPVEAYLINENSTDSSFVRLSHNSGTSVSGAIKLLRDSTSVGINELSLNGAAALLVLDQAPGAFKFFDTPSAGTYTYKVQAKGDGGATTSTVVNKCKLVVREL